MSQGPEKPARRSARDASAPWRPPTRRVFVAMIGAAAAAIAARGRLGAGEVSPDEERPRSTWSGTTRWIGHC